MRNKIILTMIVCFAAALIILMGASIHPTQINIEQIPQRGISPYPILAGFVVIIFSRFIWTSTTSFKAAREGIILLAIFQILLVCSADISGSHILNHNWPGHAKFHSAWLVSLIILLQLLAIYYIIFTPQHTKEWFERFKFACILGFSLPLSVVFPSILMPLYNGSYNITGFPPDPSTLGINVVLLLFIILFFVWIALLNAIKIRYKKSIALDYNETS